ncbi:dehydrogenase/reductase SDR family member 11-like isoform X2 [Hylaeus anthracinus]|uniref:dehydrogenase/reductase SDR family member 11-like isoform X2 n=1 Tax=Hylaeus anthracinus TaxID=313031 RepID=UPI0023B96036|nr:dehydrogenase/reductase SDR family member 11-like isoform X2 [Hylaeus anthracinus]
MDFWKGKTAIVIDAGADISAAIAKALMEHHVKVVGVAQTKSQLKEVARKWCKDTWYPFECDLKKKQDIEEMFEWVETKFGGADILVNNAKIASMTSIIEGPISSYKGVIETNIFAPAILAREFTKSVGQRNASGHIININSINGRSAETMQIPLGIYGVSKYGLNALVTELRRELILAKLKIKVTNVSPGAVLTDTVPIVSGGTKYAIPLLQDKDIVDAVIYALGTPQAVEIY